MAEGSKAIVSRRSTRYFEIEGNMEAAGSDIRSSSSSDETEKQREAITSKMTPRVDVGKDLGSLFPKTAEDMGKQGGLSFCSSPDKALLFWNSVADTSHSHEKPPSSKSFYKVKS